MSKEAKHKCCDYTTLNAAVIYVSSDASNFAYAVAYCSYELLPQMLCRFYTAHPVLQDGGLVCEHN
jgi:hypothetical protein